MNRSTALFFWLAAGLMAAQAQTAAKPASTTHGAASTHAATHVTTTATAIKLPPGVPPASGPVHVASSATLRYQEIKIGTGPEGVSGKLWHVKYTGWRAADGVKFDAWDEHKRPAIGKDGKPELGPDGKPVLADPQPVVFPQGMGGLVPGFDSGLTGMRVGGKRRLFIPWQMAYGLRNIPDHGDHPGIPSKSDLIFDVELVEVTDMPQAMQPGMPTPHAAPGGGGQQLSVPAHPAAPPPAPSGSSQVPPSNQAQPSPPPPSNPPPQSQPK